MVVWSVLCWQFFSLFCLLHTVKAKCISMPFKVFHIMKDAPVDLCKLKMDELSHASLEQLQIVTAEMKPKYSEQTILTGTCYSKSQTKIIPTICSEEQRHCRNAKSFPRYPQFFGRIGLNKAKIAGIDSIFSQANREKWCEKETQESWGFFRLEAENFKLQCLFQI